MKPTELVMIMTPLELAEKLVQAEAGRDLIARMAEEYAEKLEAANTKIVSLQLELMYLKLATGKVPK